MDCSSCVTEAHDPPGSADLEEVYSAAARAAFRTLMAATTQNPVSTNGDEQKEDPRGEDRKFDQRLTTILFSERHAV
jgi:hypothetical protein